MTKTLNQIIFPLHQNQNIFSATLGIRIFFLEKKQYSQLVGWGYGVQQYISYIMATSFSSGRSRSTRREPPTMDKQLVHPVL